LIVGFAAAMRIQRLKAGLTQEQLAEAAGLHPRTVQLLEAAEREPGLTTVAALADALDVPLPDLLSDALARART